MGEHQCAFCGHVQTGFETQDWNTARNSLIEECAKQADLRARVFGGEPTTNNERLIAEHIAIGIRAMKI